MPSGSDGRAADRGPRRRPIDFMNGRIHVLVALLLLVNSAHGQSTGRRSCSFPETTSQSFFFDFDASTPAGTVIANSVVEPADAELKIKSVRSNNLKSNFTDRLEIRSQSNGQFVITTTQSLQLPPFPSIVNETIVYVTVECNRAPYPLMSIRIRNRNSFAPRFLNEPYEIFVPQDIRLDSIINTPVVAVDEDPASDYAVTYELAGGRTDLEVASDVHEPVDLQSLPAPFDTRRYARTQIPLAFQLRVRAPLRKKVYYLNVTAADGQNPPRRSSALLKVIVGQPAEIASHFSQREYYANFTTTWNVDTELVLNQPIVAYFADRAFGSSSRRPTLTDEIHYELIPSQFSRLFELNPRTGRLYLKIRPYEEVANSVELGVRAFPLANPEMSIEAKIVLTDVSEVRLTYFAQCHYDVHLPENSPFNTKVAKFVVRGDIAGIDLLNGTEYFAVDRDGDVTVARDAVIDYEEVDHIIVKARLRSSTALHPKSLELCQIATIEVHVDDQNDHSPRFPKNMFTFYTEDEKPYNNTEIGTIRAMDDDKGPFGKVKYRVLDDPSTPVPFSLFESDGGVTIFFTQPDRVFYPERSYTFTVEAFDAKENPRTSRVTIRVFFYPKPEGETAESEERDESMKKPTQTSTTEVSTTTTELSAAAPAKPSKSVKIRKKNHRTLGAVNVDKLEGGHPLDSVTEESNDAVESDDGEPEVPEVEGHESFEHTHYNFTLDGPLDHGQYVGAIRLRPADQLDEQSGEVEYSVEDGISGFVLIDPTYGTIRVDEKLVEDSYEQIRFAAQARRKGQVVATTVVSVFMNENASIYSQPPQFEQSIYRFELEENQPAQTFAQVEAHHRAAELNKDKIWYTLNRERDAAGFRIDPETGWLRSKEPFDAEAKKLYSLKINACLESNTRSCARAEAIVVIRDENDSAPQFNQRSYTLTIPPDLSGGTDLLQVRAEDPDSGQNGEVRYEISSSSAAEVAALFKINERTGELRLERGLPADRSNFAVYISAHDLGDPPMQSTAEVRVTVSADAKYTNQHAPEFEDFRYEFSRNVPIQIGTIVARVHASDPDQGADGRVWYKFAEDTPLTRKFIVDKKSGEIRVISPITRENGDLVQLVVEAHDQSGDFPRKSETVVLLHLLDDGAEALEFLPLPKTVYISTAKPLGSTIFKVGLKNSNLVDVKYSVEQDLKNEYFAVIDDLLVVQAKLKPGIYRITIRATATTPAKGQTSVESHSLRMIVMTDREKYPVFEKLSYEMRIAPNANFPIKLPGFNATVKEGRIGYSLYNAEGRESVGGVKIDAITGQLTVFDEFVRLVTEDLPRGTVFVVVRATNLDHPTFFSDVGVRLGLKLSGRDLTFTSRLYRLITKENTPPGSTINTARIGVQDANLFSGVRYSIEPSDYFDIRENGTIVIRNPIDLESLPAEWKGVVEATVTARYFGQEAKAEVQIKIDDVDEFEPVFDQSAYTVEVDADTAAGTQIESVHATDADFADRNELTYRAVVGNAIGIVNVTKDGRLVVSPQGKFTPGQNYSMIIQAGRGNGRTSEAAVKFNVRSKTELTTQTPEPTAFTTTQSTASFATRVPSKWTPERANEKMVLPPMPDRSDWDFRIADGNENGRITVEKMNKTTAQLGLRTEMLGTRTDKPEDLILLEITNLDDPFERVQANMSVDLQKVIVKPLTFADARPEINVQLATVEPTRPFHRIGVQCPIEECRFELTENPLQLFSVDPKTGDLFLQKLPAQAPLGDHEVLITVHANSQTIQRVFTVNIRNDANQTDGNAVEGDSSGIEGKSTETFELKSTTSLSTTPPTSASTVTPSSLKLTSIAGTSRQTTPTASSTSASSTPSTTRPKLIEPLLETLPPFVDPPIPTIRPEDESSEASTIAATQITVQSSTLDPAAPKPKLQFDQEHYRFEVVKPKHHVEIGRLNVIGASKVKMRITPDQYRRWFGIDPNTNTLYIREVPEELRGRQRAEFEVTVQDAADSKRRAQTAVTIDLLLPDDEEQAGVDSSVSTSTSAPTPKTTQSPANALSSLLSSLASTAAPTTEFSSDPTTEETAIFSTPDLSPTVRPQPTATGGFRFQHPLYTAMLLERQYGNRGTVVNVHPAPLREDLKDVTFAIVTNQSALPFYVRNSTGELIVFDNVDRETINEYRFNISATKMDDPTKSITAEVKVTILDVNDNYPLFENPPYVVPIDSTARPGAPLVKFHAVDPDEGPNGRVTYRIVENFENLFDINGNGELSLTTKLPPLPADLFNITISAIDSGRPALRSQHQLQIQVFPDADEQPAFKKPEYMVEIPRHSEVGVFVAQVVAGSIPLDYLLLENSNDLFGIDQRGLVQLRRKPTTDEQNRYHSLTVIAESPTGKSANTTLNVFVEGDPIVVTVTPAPAQATTSAPRCQFKSKIYNAEVRENVAARTKLTKVETTCAESVRFVASQMSSEFERESSIVISDSEVTEDFELNEQTGEVFVVEALDREKKSLHFIVLNFTLQPADDPEQRAHRRQANHPIAEYTKNKLASNQALIVVKVLDENDNPPVLARLTTDDQYVFVVDYQAPILQAIARIQAFDPDEQPKLTFGLSPNDFFVINSTSGVVNVVRSLDKSDEEQFDLEVSVSDGVHRVTAPLKLYKLAPGLNLAVLTVEAPESDVDEIQAARKLSGLIEKDVRVLAKQVFTSDVKPADPQRTHLIVYALDRTTKIPVDEMTLKTLLDKSNSSLRDDELPISGVSLPAGSSNLRFSPTELILLGVCGCLIVLACCLFYLLLRCCKRRSIAAKPDLKYMVGSQDSNPRPYNVELISRKTAQNVLAARPLPDPYEEVTMSPRSRASMIASSGVYAADASQRTVSSTVTDEMPNQPRTEPEPPAIQIVRPINAEHE